MSYVERQPSRKQSHTLTPGVAALLGVAFGWALAILCAFAPPRDFSYRILVILLVSLGPFGGIFGYILWLSVEPVRWERLRKITRLIAFPSILGLLVAFPDFWWRMGRSSGPLPVVMLLGGVCATALFAVGAGWGMIHLAGQLASSFRQTPKPGADSRTGGVWDRELDQD